MRIEVDLWWGDAWIAQVPAENVNGTARVWGVPVMRLHDRAWLVGRLGWIVTKTGLRASPRTNSVGPDEASCAWLAHGPLWLQVHAPTEALPRQPIDMRRELWGALALLGALAATLAISMALARAPAPPQALVLEADRLPARWIAASAPVRAIAPRPIVRETKRNDETSAGALPSGPAHPAAPIERAGHRVARRSQAARHTAAIVTQSLAGLLQSASTPSWDLAAADLLRDRPSLAPIPFQPIEGPAVASIGLGWRGVGPEGTGLAYGRLHPRRMPMPRPICGSGSCAPRQDMCGRPYRNVCAPHWIPLKKALLSCLSADAPTALSIRFHVSGEGRALVQSIAPEPASVAGLACAQQTMNRWRFGAWWRDRGPFLIRVTREDLEPQPRMDAIGPVQ